MVELSAHRRAWVIWLSVVVVWFCGLVIWQVTIANPEDDLLEVTAIFSGIIIGSLRPRWRQR